MIVYKWLGLRAEKIVNLLNILNKQIDNAHWEGDKDLAAKLEQEAARLKLKLEYGETHDVPF